MVTLTITETIKEVMTDLTIVTITEAGLKVLTEETDARTTGHKVVLTNHNQAEVTTVEEEMITVANALRITINKAGQAVLEEVKIFSLDYMLQKGPNFRGSFVLITAGSV